MRTRNIVLTDRQAEMVEDLVSSGRYQNASEVLRDGLRLLERQEAEDKARIDALRDAAQVGLDDIADGRYRTFATAGDVEDHLAALTTRTLAKSRR